MIYPTPVQFDREDRTFGGKWTLRQVVYLFCGLGAAGVLSTVYWLLTGRLDPFTIAGLFVVFGAPAAAFAHLSDPEVEKFRGMPLDRYLESVTRFNFLPRTWPPRS
ncbi:PrgI family protein [Ammonifex thiophilus]|uniref:PrgI family protein n=1 Tax=Ammonifex thiophilus TaxID=444093 RepID=UPI001403883F|nr:PrgI family protein [Ammonifex thiophilus]